MQPTTRHIAALLAVAPTVGAEFQAVSYVAHLDRSHLTTVQHVLHVLRDAGHIEFTGKVGRWRRLR